MPVPPADTAPLRHKSMRPTPEPTWTAGLRLIHAGHPGMDRPLQRGLIQSKPGGLRGGAGELDIPGGARCKNQR